MSQKFISLEDAAARLGGGLGRHPGEPRADRIGEADMRDEAVVEEAARAAAGGVDELVTANPDYWPASEGYGREPTKYVRPKQLPDRRAVSICWRKFPTIISPAASGCVPRHSFWAWHGTACAMPGAERV